MSRDLDLALAILRRIEEDPVTQGSLDISIDGFSDEEVSYHVMLSAKEGFIEATDHSSKGKFLWKPDYLLWPGHDFLEAAKDDRRWKKAKEIVLQRGGGLTFKVVKAVLIQLMKGAVFG